MVIAEDDDRAEETVIQRADGQVLSTELSSFLKSDLEHAHPIARGDLDGSSLSLFDSSDESILR